MQLANQSIRCSHYLFVLVLLATIFPCSSTSACQENELPPETFKGDVTLDVGNRNKSSTSNVAEKLKGFELAINLRNEGKWDEAYDVMRKLRKNFPNDRSITERFIGMMAIEMKRIRNSNDKGKLHSRYLEMAALSRDFIQGENTPPAVRKKLSQALINEAIVHALGDDPETCLASLQLASIWGFDDMAQLYFIDDFSSIRDTERFREIFGEKAVEFEDRILKQVRATIDTIPPYEFELKTTTVNGEAIDISQFRDKLVFMNLCSNRDKSRDKGVAIFKKMAEKYSDQGIQFIGVGFEMDRKNAEANSKQFFEKHEINYPFITGDQSILDKAKGLKGFPTLIIIDGQGRVRSALNGQVPIFTIEAFIKLYKTDRLSHLPMEEAGEETTGEEKSDTNNSTEKKDGTSETSVR